MRGCLGGVHQSAFSRVARCGFSAVSTLDGAKAVETNDLVTKDSRSKFAIAFIFYIKAKVRLSFVNGQILAGNVVLARVVLDRITPPHRF